VDQKTIRKTRRAALAALIAAGATACGASPITSSRIETAIAPTFANLVQVQVSLMGLPSMAASDFATKATCRKPGTASSTGSGEWVCVLDWQGPDRQMLRDTFDLFVTTEGCYTATASAETLGGPTLKTSTGNDVRNLLYTFEGCFDTM
jgi:hypothetical protein